MKPKIIQGNHHKDARGCLVYNNDFDASVVKRMYVVSHQNTDFVRAWQGHEIEQRYYSAVLGSFKIELIAIDNWKQPSKSNERLRFVLEDKNMDVLYIPPGYVSSIQSLEEGSKLLIMANSFLDENEDHHRFSVDYFD